MAKTRYAPDKGLTARMGLTMFLLGLVFVAFVTALVFVLAAFHMGSGGIIFLAVLLGLGLGVGSFLYSDKIALRAAGAVEVTPQDGPQAAELHGVIDRLCALADMPKPRVAIARSPMPNAFATGRNSKKAVLCVTTALLDGRLDEREIEGVIAHEMSHVAHRDVVVMTIASFVGIIAGLLIRFAFYGELFGGGGGGRGRGGNDSSGNAGLVMLAMMAVGIVVYAISFLLIRLLSRYRELAADRAGALLTGQPSALASALTKVSGDIARIPQRDLRQAEPLNAFFFAPALSGAGQSLATLFSTHPSLERRLKQLSEISEQLAR
ncbi:MAG TPA: zinc metalloprotease HtpX [Streptosporangiaceae bacterium]|nr:zinc metalloprotease HtpX [Streptosporangiaceae bacterium]